MSTFSRVAIIPARGGSKRLPRKNILPFRGKPMLAYSIEAALNSGCFDHVYVSTEDDEIAAVAEAAGALVDKRSSSLAGDTNTVVEVCHEFLLRKQSEGINWQQLVILYATCPLRRVEDVSAIVTTLEQGDCDVAMAVSEYDHYVHQALSYDDQGYAQAVFPHWITSRAASVPAMHVSNGCLYATWCDTFMAEPTLYPPRLKTYLMPREYSVDIDTAEDLAMAEAMASYLERRGQLG